MLNSNHDKNHTDFSINPKQQSQCSCSGKGQREVPYLFFFLLLPLLRLLPLLPLLPLLYVMIVIIAANTILPLLYVPYMNILDVHVLATQA